MTELPRKSKREEPQRDEKEETKKEVKRESKKEESPSVQPEQPQLQPQQLLEHPTLSALTYPFKVVVSPFRAFREIVQNPNFIGFAFVVVLFIAATAGAEAMRASKIFLDDGSQTISLLNSNLFVSQLTFYLIQSSSSFLLNWLIYAGVLLLMARFFGEKGAKWRSFLVVVGYAFSVLVLYIVVNAVLILTLPEIHFPLAQWSSVTPEDAAAVNQIFIDQWGPAFAVQVQNVLSVAFQFWLVSLGAVALRNSSQVSWGKAIMISVVAYFVSVFLTSLLSMFFVA